MRREPCRTVLLAAVLTLGACGQQAQTSSAPPTADVASTTATADGKAGRIVIPARFDEAGQFSDGLAAVRIGAKFGYIDKQGTIVIQPQFDFANPFAEGVAAAAIGA